MNRFRMTLAILGALSIYFVPSMRADENNKETHLTVNRPLQVQNILLAPGSHVFKLMEQGVIGIYDAEGTEPEGIVLGWPAYRAEVSDKPMFTVSQSQGIQPAILQYWFYPGDNFGFEFSITKPAYDPEMKSKKKRQASTARGISTKPT